jgi:LmbE family N-acetylglucosaminyl deacetylase
MQHMAEHSGDHKDTVANTAVATPAAPAEPQASATPRFIERRLRPRIASLADTSHQILETYLPTVSAAATWVRNWRDARKQTPAAIANQVLDSLTIDSSKALNKRVLVVVAHPDDEAIGAGAILRGIKDAIVVHVTDGAPSDEGYAHRKGFATRESYAQARRQEVVNALSLIGIGSDRIRGLGFVDGEVAWRLVELCNAVMSLFDELRPDVVLTHPYEGGHSDHDSTAFAVHLAAGILQREGIPAPVLLELTSYHNYNGRRRLYEFLPLALNPIKTIKLTSEARETKRKMFDLFTSQRALLRSFPIEVERFRQAPRYLFTVPPHDGELDYERLCKKISGAEWRAQAQRALETLRAKRQFRGVGEGAA